MSTPGCERYDAVVVGAGLGGISAGALLAKAGASVLVCERSDGPGGYAHAFRRGPYVFDPAIHFTVEAGKGRLLDVLLQFLDVGDECDLVGAGHVYQTSLPGLDLRVPSGHEEATEAHAALFPDDADGIRRFFEFRRTFYFEAMHVAMQLSLKELEEAVEKLPTFFRYRNATLREVLDDCLIDERAKAVCGSMWPYVGLPPSMVSFQLYAQFMSTLVEGGAYYSRGSFQRLADAFATALRRNGGELLLQNEVARILVEDGAVRGVALADGSEVSASVVVSNADAHLTFKRLLGTEHLPPRLRKRLDTLEPSLSAVVVFAATTLDVRSLELAHEVFLYKHWDHEETYRDVLDGRPGGMWASLPTLADPSLAPEGEHLAILTSLAPYDPGQPWERARERWSEQILADFDPVLPGLRDSLTFLEVATPLALEQHTLNYRGATYGWAVKPSQMGSKRLDHRTPVEGLFLSGHWTHEGPGSLRAITSGVQTARLVLADWGRPDAVPAFRASELAPYGGRRWRG